MLRRLLRNPRGWSTTLLEVAGFGAISYGIWRISPDAGLIAAGLSLILIGALAS